jgi:hypothetical protein
MIPMCRYILDIDYMSTFQCPDCGPDPDTVVMDATPVAFRKELLSWDGLFRNTADRSEPYDKSDTARYYITRIFFRKVLLHLYADRYMATVDKYLDASLLW